MVPFAIQDVVFFLALYTVFCSVVPKRICNCCLLFTNVPLVPFYYTHEGVVNKKHFIMFLLLYNIILKVLPAFTFKCKNHECNYFKLDRVFLKKKSRNMIFDFLILDDDVHLSISKKRQNWSTSTIALKKIYLQKD